MRYAAKVVFSDFRIKSNNLVSKSTYATFPVLVSVFHSYSDNIHRRNVKINGQLFTCVSLFKSHDSFASLAAISGFL